MCHHHVYFSSESLCCTVVIPCCRTVSSYEMYVAKSLIVSVLFEGRVLLPLVGELHAPTLATHINKLSPISSFQKEAHGYRKSTRWMQPCAFRYTAQYNSTAQSFTFCFTKGWRRHVCSCLSYTVLRRSWNIYSIPSSEGNIELKNIFMWQFAGLKTWH